MSLEALAGKNSVNHVGKLYNLAARAIAEELVRDVPALFRAECYLVSRIGAPIDRPALAHVRLGAAGELSSNTERLIADTVRRHVARVPDLWRDVTEGRCSIY
jgi:S-adenosylmethionine synthetase